jgi:hypothetical protein
MSEKKVVSRNLAIVLGIIAIILLVGLVGAMVNYTMVINNKDATYRDYTSTHSHSNSEYNSLNSEYQDYVSNHSHNNSEYDSMWTPYLIKVDIKASAYTPFWAWDPPSYLQVYGYVCNVNKNWAYNCKLHVVANTTLGVAIDTHIDLGTITGESWWHVDSVVYSAIRSELVNWTITPEWTDSP